jgi:perosamine synthetase
MPPQDEGHAWHLFIVRLRTECFGGVRNEFIRDLKTEGIGVSVHFIPLHLHPFYRQKYGYRRGDFQNAEDAYDRAISLPIYPDLSDAEVERVVEVVGKLVERYSGRIRMVTRTRLPQPGSPDFSV